MSSPNQNIDDAIFAVLGAEWRKTTSVIVRAADQCRHNGITVDYEQIAERLQNLAQHGALEAQGDLQQWRHSEVRSLPFIGPHEGRELDLMLAGTKPLSMFAEPIPPEFEYFPETDFDALVAEGKFVKHVRVEDSAAPGGNVKVRRVFYALAHEAWRIPSVLLVLDTYATLTPGWRPDLDRVIGLLLGYKREDIEAFLARVAENRARVKD